MKYKICTSILSLFISVSVLARISIDDMREHANSIGMENRQLVESFNDNQAESNESFLLFATVGSDECEFENIQDAIDSGFEEVRIASNKEYHENIFLTDISITLRGGFTNCIDANANEQGDGKSHIIGVKNASQPVISITGHKQRSTIRIENLDLSGGTGTNFLTGGGITTLSADASVMLTNMEIHNNNSTSGGGIAIQGNVTGTDTDFLLIDTLIHNNFSTFGGGIYCTGVNSSVIISGNSGLNSNHSTLDLNVEDTGNGGGAFITESCQMTMYSGTQNSDQLNDLRGIAFNSASNQGGGIYATNGAIVNLNGHRYCFESMNETVCYGDDSEPLNINNNFSKNNGAGIYASGGQAGIILYAGLVENNNSLDSQSSGAGMYIGNTASLVTSSLQQSCWHTSKCNLFRNNNAKRSGGALFVDFSTANISSTYFENNRANEGTAIDIGGHSNVTLHGSIFSRNGDNGNNGYLDESVISTGGTVVTADIFNNTFVDNNNTVGVVVAEHEGGSLNIKYSIIHEQNVNIKALHTNFFPMGMDLVTFECLIMHETSSLSVDGVASLGDIIVDDPGFIDRAAGDYHLNAPASPAIDFCNNQGFILSDIDRESRGWDDPFVTNNNNSPDYIYDVGADETYGSDIIFEDGFAD